MSVLCTICARGGSKGVPKKNFKEIAGKPLIAHSIEQAKESNLFEKIVVSTDSVDIQNISKEFGAESWFLRPKELSIDSAPKLPAIRHLFIESEKKFRTEFEYIVDLDASSPLRSIQDITNSFNIFLDSGFENLVSVTESRRNPYFNMIEMDKGVVKLSKEISPRPTSRQEVPDVYDMNASIYIWKRSSLLNDNHIINSQTGIYMMPEERSYDIDSQLDWQIVEMIMEKKINNG
tara:strand:+ start:21642 stop:22343 length:702 start_codon:yes stop_codon:yes gene_type:complete